MRSLGIVLVTSFVVGAGCATTREASWKDEAPKTASAEGAEKAAALVAEGDEAWKGRADRAQLEKALQKWEEAAALAPSAELYVKLSRGHYLLGDGFHAVEDNAEMRDKEYEIGLAWAERAVKLAAPEYVQAVEGGAKHKDAIRKAPKEAVPAMYWWATNLGKWAASKGFATRLKYKDDIKATMEHVKALDEGYFYAAPWRYFGAFEAVTAGLAGGDLKKSEENFAKAVALAPNYLGTKVLWAEFLATKTQDKATYEKLLKEVLAADPAVDPEIEPENRIEQKKAQKLLAKIDDAFAS